MSEEPKNGDNHASMLAKFLGKLDPLTLIVVIFFGGSNFLATHQTSDTQRQQIDQTSEQQRRDIDRAIRQINDLHRSLDDFEDRQRDAIAKGNQALANQGKMLENDTKILEQLKANR